MALAGVLGPSWPESGPTQAIAAPSRPRRRAAEEKKEVDTVEAERSQTEARLVLKRKRDGRRIYACHAGGCSGTARSLSQRVRVLVWAWLLLATES